MASGIDALISSLQRERDRIDAGLLGTIAPEGTGSPAVAADDADGLNSYQSTSDASAAQIEALRSARTKLDEAIDVLRRVMPRAEMSEARLPGDVFRTRVKLKLASQQLKAGTPPPAAADALGERLTDRLAALIVVDPWWIGEAGPPAGQLPLDGVAHGTDLRLPLASDDKPVEEARNGAAPHEGVLPPLGLVEPIETDGSSALAVAGGLGAPDRAPIARVPADTAEPSPPSRPAITSDAPVERPAGKQPSRNGHDATPRAGAASQISAAEMVPQPIPELGAPLAVSAVADPAAGSADLASTLERLDQLEAGLSEIERAASQATPADKVRIRRPGGPRANASAAPALKRPRSWRDEPDGEAEASRSAALLQDEADVIIIRTDAPVSAAESPRNPPAPDRSTAALPRPLPAQRRPARDTDVDADTYAAYRAEVPEADVEIVRGNSPLPPDMVEVSEIAADGTVRRFLRALTGERVR